MNTIWFTFGENVSHLNLRVNTYYYRRRIPKSISHLTSIKYIHRSLSKNKSLAKKLSNKLDHLIDLAEVALQLNQDVSYLLVELKLNNMESVDIFKLYRKSLDVSPARIRKIESLLAVLRVLLPNDLKQLNMAMLDTVKGNLKKLPKRNIQKYREMSIEDLLKIDIPDEHLQSTETINDYLKTLNTLLKFAYEREVIARPLSAATIKTKKVARELRLALDKKDISLLFSTNNEALKALYKISYYSGMRLSELYKCKISTIDNVKCFDLTDKELDMKTHSSYRLIPVHSAIEDAAEDLLLDAISLKPGYATRHATDTLKNDRKSLYSLRHSFATELASKGVETGVIAELLGHTHSGMTLSRYVKGFGVDVLSDAVNKL